MTYQPNQKIPRIRSKPHMAYVASLPCIVCGWHEVQVHHIMFAQPRARGLKSGDNFTVGLCAPCHTALHARGDERAFWHALGIDPIAAADRLWLESQAARAGREMP